MKPGLRNLASALLLAALVWGGHEFILFAGGGGPSVAVPEAKMLERKSFHATDRAATAPTPLQTPSCAECHDAAPHDKNPKYRAFINLHTISMDCGPCHLEGKTLQHVQAGKEGFSQIRTRLRTGKEGEGSALPEAEYSEGTHVLPDGVSLVRTPPDCQTCHRRGSRFLKEPGLYEEYRRRVLEDLDVLVLLRD